MFGVPLKPKLNPETKPESVLVFDPQKMVEHLGKIAQECTDIYNEMLGVAIYPWRAPHPIAVPESCVHVAIRGFRA